MRGDMDGDVQITGPGHSGERRAGVGGSTRRASSWKGAGAGQEGKKEDQIDDATDKETRRAVREREEAGQLSREDEKKRKNDVKEKEKEDKKKKRDEARAAGSKQKKEQEREEQLEADKEVEEDKEAERKVVARRKEREKAKINRRKEREAKAQKADEDEAAELAQEALDDAKVRFS